MLYCSQNVKEDIMQENEKPISEEALMAEYEAVYYYILAICQNQNEAQDITQETFLKAMLSSTTFQGRSSLYTWLCTIAKNLWINKCQKRKKEIFLEEKTKEVTGLEKSMEILFCEKAASRRIHQILHVMEEPYKEVFSLRTFGELSFADIADLFSKTESWARVTYYRSKKKIVDHVVSDATAFMVKKHLDSCENCKAEYQILCANLSMQKDENQVTKLKFQEFQNKMKKWKTVLIAILITCFLFVGGGYFLTQVPFVHVSDDVVKITQIYRFKENGETKLFIQYGTPVYKYPSKCNITITKIKDGCIRLHFNIQKSVVSGVVKGINIGNQYDVIDAIPDDFDTIYMGDKVVWRREEHKSEQVPAYVYEYDNKDVEAWIHDSDPKYGEYFEAQYKDGRIVRWNLAGKVISDGMDK